MVLSNKRIYMYMQYISLQAYQAYLDIMKMLSTLKVVLLSKADRKLQMLVTLVLLFFSQKRHISGWDQGTWKLTRVSRPSVKQQVPVVMKLDVASCMSIHQSDWLLSIFFNTYQKWSNKCPVHLGFRVIIIVCNVRGEH